ncbi:FecR family protein [Sphingobacterium detergens]
MKKRHIAVADLIAKFLQGNLCPSEEIELLKCAQEEPYVQKLLDQYAKGQILKEDFEFIDSIDNKYEWDNFLLKINQTPKKTVLYKWRYLLVAASVIIAFSIGTLWVNMGEKNNSIIPDREFGYQNDILPGKNKATITFSDGRVIDLKNDKAVQVIDEETNLYIHDNKIDYSQTSLENIDKISTIKTPRGGTFQLELSDGSEVWLNSDSEIEIPVHFSKERRLVKLIKGEAYFKVAKQRQTPFIVNTVHYEVQVTGTEFNVNSYSKYSTKTILTEGLIKIHKNNEIVPLYPGYAIANEGEDLNINHTDIEEALSWKDGFFYFNGKDLNQILQDVARWYDVEIKYEKGVHIKKLKYQGGIKRNVTLANVCKMLTTLSGHEFDIVEKNLIVKSRKEENEIN